MKWFIIVLSVVAAASASVNIPPFGEGVLYDNLREFVDITPYDRIIQTIEDYHSNDPEVQLFFKIVFGSELQNLIRDVEAYPEVIGLLNWLEERGIYAYQVVNYLNHRLGIEELSKPSAISDRRVVVQRKGGVNGLIHDINAIIPVDEYVALYHRLVETSPAYVEFINKVTSPEIAALPAKVKSNQHYVNIIEQLAKCGIHINAPQDLSSEVISYKPSEELARDFKDIIALIPTDRIKVIIMKYIIFSSKVRAVIAFLNSKQYAELEYAVEALKECQDLVLYLYDAGVDVVKYIQEVHDYLGQKPYVPPPLDTYASDNDVARLLDEIKNVIPVDKIKTLYNKKLQTSEAFAKFIAQVEDQRFQEIVNNLYRHDTFQLTLRAAKATGLDFVAVYKLIRSITGIHLPEPPTTYY